MIWGWLLDDYMWLMERESTYTTIVFKLVFIFTGRNFMFINVITVAVDNESKYFSQPT